MKLLMFVGSQSRGHHGIFAGLPRITFYYPHGEQDVSLQLHSRSVSRRSGRSPRYGETVYRSLPFLFCQRSAPTTPAGSLLTVPAKACGRVRSERVYRMLPVTAGRSTAECAIIRRSNKCSRPKPQQETSEYASKRNMTLAALGHSEVSGFFSTPSTLRTRAMKQCSS